MKKKTKGSSKNICRCIILCLIILIIHYFVLFTYQNEKDIIIHGGKLRQSGWSTNKNDTNTDLLLWLQKQTQDANKKLNESIAAMRPSDQRALLQRFSNVLILPNKTLQQPIQE